MKTRSSSLPLCWGRIFHSAIAANEHADHTAMHGMKKAAFPPR
jgi:hypothetical protein